MDEGNNFRFRPLSQGLGFDKTIGDTRDKKSKTFKDQGILRPAYNNQNQSMRINQSQLERVNPVNPTEVQGSVSHRNHSQGMNRKLQSEVTGSSVAGLPKVKEVHQEFVLEKLEKTRFEIPHQDFKMSGPEVPNPTPVSRSLKKMLDSLPPSFDFKEDKKKQRHIEAPLAPPSVYEKSSQSPQRSPFREKSGGFDVTLDNSLLKAFPKEEGNRHFYHQMVNPIPRYKEMSSNFASAAIDSLILLGLSSLFVVSLVAITRVDIVTMLTSSRFLGQTLLELGFLYVGVTLLYFMLARGLFGSTMGDWAFDVQLGSEKERSHILYPFQVVFRTLIILVTGIVIVPLVSLGFGKDIAYYFSGLKLYSRQY